jgi:hypothetical protein
MCWRVFKNTSFLKIPRFPPPFSSSDFMETPTPATVVSVTSEKGKQVKKAPRKRKAESYNKDGEASKDGGPTAKKAKAKATTPNVDGSG